MNRESYTKKILDLLGKNEVIVLTGHRRTGKSCILECLKDLLHDSGNMMYLDMEDPDNASITTFEHLNTWIKEHISNDKRNYILIDEIQEIKEFEKTLRYWIKQEGYEVYVGQLDGKEIDFVARRGDETIYYQVTLRISNEETYEREFGNLKLIKDNYPKYVITMDPLSTMINDEGIKAIQAKDFLADC